MRNPNYNYAWIKNTLDVPFKNSITYTHDKKFVVSKVIELDNYDRPFTILPTTYMTLGTSLFDLIESNLYVPANNDVEILVCSTGKAVDAVLDLNPDECSKN